MTYKDFQINNMITGCLFEPLEQFTKDHPNIMCNYFDELFDIYPVSKDLMSYYTNIIIFLLDYKNTKYNLINNIDQIKLYEKACIKCNYVVIEWFFDNKHIPTSNEFKLIFKNKNTLLINKIIDLFVKYGYIIDYADFILITKSRIIYQYDIDPNFLTNEFNQLCDELEFFPPYYKYTINFLHRKSTQLDNITSFNDFKKYVRPDLQPDIICLTNACSNGTLRALRFLIEECNLIPNNECLENVINNYKPQLKYIIKKYIEYHPN
jgi:hypothetical protein